jgi:hypothetical protein
MLTQENTRLERQLRELCTFLPTLSQRGEFRRLKLIYERGGKHMLDSENLQRIVDQAHEHVQALRKLSRLFALECRLNLARYHHRERSRSDYAGQV